MQPFREYANRHSRAVHVFVDDVASHHDRSLFSEGSETEGADPRRRGRSYPRRLPPLGGEARGYSLAGGAGGRNTAGAGTGTAGGAAGSQFGSDEDEDSDADSQTKKYKLNKEPLYTLIGRVCEEVNEQRRFKGFDLLQRPPVICWGQKDPESEVPAKASAKKKHDKSAFGYIQAAGLYNKMSLDE